MDEDSNFFVSWPTLVFVILVILMDMKWYLTVVLIYIFLVS